jgi:hypothetical protein
MVLHRFAWSFALSIVIGVAFAVYVAFPAARETVEDWLRMATLC